MCIAIAIIVKCLLASLLFHIGQVSCFVHNLGRPLVKVFFQIPKTWPFIGLILWAGFWAKNRGVIQCPPTVGRHLLRPIFVP